VVHYNSSLNDQRWGRLLVRVCPYFPFSARVCLNQHHGLANRLRTVMVVMLSGWPRLREAGCPRRVIADLDRLLAAVGLRVAA
jgi:hypothetical protein